MLSEHCCCMLSERMLSEHCCCQSMIAHIRYFHEILGHAIMFDQQVAHFDRVYHVFWEEECFQVWWVIPHVSRSHLVYFHSKTLYSLCDHIAGSWGFWVVWLLGFTSWYWLSAFKAIRPYLCTPRYGLFIPLWCKRIHFLSLRPLLDRAIAFLR